MTTIPTKEKIVALLANELNISHLSKQEQQDIITQMSTVILDRISLALIAELPQPEMARIDNLLGSGQIKAVQALLTKDIPNAGKIAESVIAETMGEYHTIIAQQEQN